MFDYQLTDLVARPTHSRLLHGRISAGTLPRFMRRIINVGGELVSALPRDAFDAFCRERAIDRIERGTNPNLEATSVALYAHYSTTGHISNMVLGQLAILQRAGFAVVFISMARHIPDADWDAARVYSALLLQRRNVGRDFGAWHDLIPIITGLWIIEELLLTNDSILGPIYPFDPIMMTLRSGGDGLFGLTESWQGGVHLQSYLLLARGPAVNDVLRFLKAMHISHSKWLIVQRGELRLTPWMRHRGHRVAAVFGYDRLIAILPNHDRKILLNPTHHLWRMLVTQFGFPFLKTELIRHNPGRLSDVSEWPQVVPVTAPCTVADMLAHLSETG